MGASDDINCFFSYCHSDDEQLDNVVQQLKASLAAVYEARTGDSLAIFLDKESIGWGEDWRTAIARSLRGALIFVPIITMRYFNSAECCDELLTFFRNAERLGVTDLLLPVVIHGHSNIREDHDEEVVRIVARLQYESLEEAWVAGKDSPQWRSATLRMSKRLESALQAAEGTLSETQGSALPESGNGSNVELGAGNGPVVPIDQHGDVDFGTLTEEAERIAAILEDVNETAQTMGSIVEGNLQEDDLSKLSPGQLTFRLGGLAERIKEPALALEEQGKRLQALVTETDTHLRSLVAQIQEIDLPEAKEQLEGMKQTLAEMAELSTPLQQTDQLISSLKLLGLMNVRIRKAMHPAVRGLQAIKISFSMIHSWSHVARP